MIGSRWVPGGSVVNWPRPRELLSRGGNLYVRLLLGIPVRDATAGFRLFRRATLETIDLDAVQSTGYVLPDRPGLPHRARRAARRRGADRVRRARARRLQDERRRRDRVAAGGSPAGACRAARAAATVRAGVTIPQAHAYAAPPRAGSAWLLVAAFVVVPLVEIYVLIQVGQVDRAWWTILLLVARQHARRLADQARGRPRLAGAARGAAAAGGCRPASWPTGR